MNELLERIPEDYRNLLHPFLQDASFAKTLQTIQESELQARSESSDIFPAYEDVFKALALTPLHTVKIILIGQDPYHTPGLAQGLAFSIPENISPKSRLFPSSLKNISKALTLEGFAPLQSGDLDSWATQGVLLLNATLTVPKGTPNGHHHFGWEVLTNTLIEAISQYQKKLVWLLWGGFAQKKEAFIAPNQNHLILKASHPSGLGVYQTSHPFLMKGDVGSCGHFKAVNEWLIAHQEAPIVWSKDIWGV